MSWPAPLRRASFSSLMRILFRGCSLSKQSQLFVFCSLGLSTAACTVPIQREEETTYMLNGGTLEKAQQIAAHESPRTTKLYDRTNDEVSLDEIEKILI